MKAAVVRGLRSVLSAIRRPAGIVSVRPTPGAGDEPVPAIVFLVDDQEAWALFEALPRELKAWRLLADMEAARGRVWRRDGRTWDAGLSAGRAQAYRAAAEGVEAVLADSLELRRRYAEQAGENER